MYKKTANKVLNPKVWKDRQQTNALNRIRLLVSSGLEQFTVRYPPVAPWGLKLTVPSSAAQYPLTGDSGD